MVNATSNATASRTSRLLKKSFSGEKPCKNPNVFEGQFSKLGLFQQPARHQMNAKTLFLVASLATSVLSPIRATAEIGVGDVVGYAKTIANAYGSFMGTTEVTPACALHYWQLTKSGVYWTWPYLVKQSIRRSVVTGEYFYYTKVITDWSDDSTDKPFPLDTLRIRNYRCNLPDPEIGLINEFMETETLILAAWAAGVKKTGSFPPSQPYQAWIKFIATQVEENCHFIENPRIRETRTGIKIYDSGTYTVKPGIAGYQFSWPPLSWVGDIHDY